MATTPTFRTALNGFNREDVVRYIEFLTAKHQTEVNQLKSELEFLRNKPAAEPAFPTLVPTPEAEPTSTAEDSQQKELEAENQKLRQELTAALDAKAQAEERLQAAMEEKAAIATELETARSQQNSDKSRTGDELEAYRRAERTERLARERADQVYRQANGILSDATVKVEASASQIGNLTDQVMNQLSQLQEAVAGSKQALRDAAASMYTIRPETQE